MLSPLTREVTLCWESIDAMKLDPGSSGVFFRVVKLRGIPFLLGVTNGQDCFAGEWVGVPY
jgi:hypothetical protein